MTDAATARDRLHSKMQDSGFDAEYADQLIDAFAHELAEHIREYPASGAPCCYSCADAIDPEVQP